MTLPRLAQAVVLVLSLAPGCGGDRAPQLVELCDNGTDDDGDNRIDCADPGCARAAVCAPVCEGLACEAGTTRACGSCGTQLCGVECAWGPCGGEGSCAPGVTEPCGLCGTRTCRPDCGFGACSDEGACAPGSTRPCGNCGREPCGADCRWTGACSGEGPCAPGLSTSCGSCGTAICDATCTWGTCEGQAAGCEGQPTQPGTGGCGACGFRICQAGCVPSGCGGPTFLWCAPAGQCPAGWTHQGTICDGACGGCSTNSCRADGC